MRAYIIEHRIFDKNTNQWISKISQEGYSSYDAAKLFCENRAKNSGVTTRPFYFQSSTGFEEFYIHDILVR